MKKKMSMPKEAVVKNRTRYRWRAFELDLEKKRKEKEEEPNEKENKNDSAGTESVRRVTPSWCRENGAVALNEIDALSIQK